MITNGQRVQQGNVSSRASARAEQITVWRANVEVYHPAPDGHGSYVEYAACKHDHTSAASAETCARGLARKERARVKATRAAR